MVSKGAHRLPKSVPLEVILEGKGGIPKVVPPLSKTPCGATPPDPLESAEVARH